jgi:hypothetical protein
VACWAPGVGTRAGRGRVLTRPAPRQVPGSGTRPHAGAHRAPGRRCGPGARVRIREQRRACARTRACYARRIRAVRATCASCAQPRACTYARVHGPYARVHAPLHFAYSRAYTRVCARRACTRRARRRLQRHPHLRRRRRHPRAHLVHRHVPAPPALAAATVAAWRGSSERVGRGEAERVAQPPQRPLPRAPRRRRHRRRAGGGDGGGGRGAAGAVALRVHARPVRGTASGHLCAPSHCQGSEPETEQPPTRVPGSSPEYQYLLKLVIRISVLTKACHPNISTH